MAADGFIGGHVVKRLKAKGCWVRAVDLKRTILSSRPLGGRGVLVPGGFVLTVAHCIKWNGDGRMAMGALFIEPIRTAQGSELHLTPLAVDPVSDIAVLGSLDGQEFYEESEAFDTWQEATTPVHLATRLPQLGVPPDKPTFPVHVLTHDRGWIKGTLGRYGFPGPPVCGQLVLHAEGAINGGTSGSPVVDANGLLLGVVSHIVGEPATDSPMPIAWWALPRWVLLAIEAKSPAKQAILRRARRRFTDRVIAASPGLKGLKGKVK